MKWLRYAPTGRAHVIDRHPEGISRFYITRCSRVFHEIDVAMAIDDPPPAHCLTCARAIAKVDLDA